MANTYRISGSRDGLTVTSYRGDGSVLLGFDLDKHLTKDLAGFAVRLTPPGGEPFYLKNRLSFERPIRHDSTPEDRQAAWTDSDRAPFQRFRWQHFPTDVTAGIYKYEVIAMYFSGRDGGPLEHGPAADVSLDLVPADFGSCRIGFTRSYVSSQAYANRFGNKELRKQPKTLTYNTAEYADQYRFLGYTARRMIFSFLDEALRDRALTLDAFVYDIDEPDIVHALEKLGSRLRVFMDDAPLHTESHALEPEVKRRLIHSAGDRNVHTGHFKRFAHNKVLIQRKNGKPVKVLTGSANFSVRGLYVQANNVLIFDDDVTAGQYGAVFDQVWEDPSAAAFAACRLAQAWTPRRLKAGLPPFELCFSPHKNAAISLKKVADAIDAAESSVLFAVMELGGGGAVLSKLKTMAAKGKLFSYGVTQHVQVKKTKGQTEEQTTGVSVHGGGTGAGVLVPFAFLSKNVPPPFDKEVSGGAGQVLHNKFVVVDFNGPNPAVFTGSSNLADGGEKSNGDNLIAIYDRAIATMYGVETIRLVDHYRFRAAIKGAKSKPLLLKSGKEKWWAPYYDPKNIKNTERILFVK
jgi:phosphatidylserine/phosphatidylglycerophosphate/cardiolipin synthase-like enzyme